MENKKDERRQSEIVSEAITWLSVAGLIFTLFGAGLSYYTFYESSIPFSAGMTVSALMLCLGIVLSIICLLKSRSATSPAIVRIIGIFNLLIILYVLLNILAVALFLLSGGWVDALYSVRAAKYSSIAIIE